MNKNEIENYVDDKKKHQNSESSVKVLTVPNVIELTDKIVSDFESRLCKSCKYSTGMHNAINKDITVAYDCELGHLKDMFSLPIDFGCNKWASK